MGSILSVCILLVKHVGYSRMMIYFMIIIYSFMVLPRQMDGSLSGQGG
jgi:hypothetical protein